MQQKYLAEIHYYPVKSLKGLSLASAEVARKGLSMDRRLMVVDLDGRFITQRQYSRMALIETALTGQELILKAPGMPDMIIAISEDGADTSVTVWKDTCIAKDQGEEAAQWLSQFLEKPVRLVYMPDQTHRQVNQNYAKRIDDEVGFADGFPFLLTSRASLEELNSRLPEPIPMNRFRPNLIVENCSPFEEDSWKVIQIGSLRFEVVKPCSRCVITTIDQSTGNKGAEPLQTLASYRKQAGGIMFGQNLVHQNLGKLTVGDKIIVLEKKMINQLIQPVEIDHD